MEILETIGLDLGHGETNAENIDTDDPMSQVTNV
jgi:hypothetical protein